jgi:ketosteroid isomerase-like protein
MTTIHIDSEIRRLFETIDAMDADGFAAAFTPDGSFRFGNAEAVVGREAIRDSVAGFFSTIGGLHHRLTGVWTGAWEHGHVRAVEAEVVYTRQDRTTTPPIPATSTLRMRGHLVQDYRVFVDLAPLLS